MSTELARAFGANVKLYSKGFLVSKEISQLRLSSTRINDRLKRLETETTSLKNEKAALEEQLCALGK